MTYLLTAVNSQSGGCCKEFNTDTDKQHQFSCNLMKKMILESVRNNQYLLVYEVSYTQYIHIQYINELNELTQLYKTPRNIITINSNLF